MHSALQNEEIDHKGLKSRVLGVPGKQRPNTGRAVVGRDRLVGRETDQKARDPAALASGMQCTEDDGSDQ